MGHLEKDVLDEAWLLYKETGHIAYRNRLVLHYTSLVRYVAQKLRAGMPNTVDHEDLVSYGMFGLMDAIEKFDLDKGVKFETYAIARIRGAIIDEIRSLDWVPRSVRSKARDIEKARTELEGELGRPAEHAEVAQILGLSLEDYWQLASDAAVSQVGALNDNPSDDASHFEYAAKPDPMASPEAHFETAEIVELLGEAITGMDERSKTILVLYYMQEMTLAEIGQILGVTESRVCQLQSKVLQILRDTLGQGGLAAA